MATSKYATPVAAAGETHSRVLPSSVARTDKAKLAVDESDWLAPKSKPRLPEEPSPLCDPESATISPLKPEPDPEPTSPEELAPVFGSDRST